MKKSRYIKIPRQEMIEEHKKLVKVLKSKAHSDDVAEAKKTRKELNEYIRGTDTKNKMKLDPKEQMEEKEESPKHESGESKSRKDMEDKMSSDHPMADMLHKDKESSDKHMDGHAHEMLKGYDSYKRPHESDEE